MDIRYSRSLHGIYEEWSIQQILVRAKQKKEDKRIILLAKKVDRIKSIRQIFWQEKKKKGKETLHARTKARRWEGEKP